MLMVVLVTLACNGSAQRPDLVAATPTVVPSPTATPVPAPDAVTEPLRVLRLERVFGGLAFPEILHLAYADDGTGRLLAVTQPGQVFVFEPGDVSATVFLDITQRVNDTGSEEGLLGLAFDPDYAKNGYFYVYYSAAEPRRSVISRFEVSGDPDAADPASERILLEVAQPFANHNGGHLAFGPDGYLYIGLGDGGSGGDPFGNGQNRGVLLGKILRIDVRRVDETGNYVVPADNPFVGQSGARPEVWAYGLRNPWRFNFDRLTGALWAADVGQNALEEVDIIRKGGNYGWNIMEGSQCFRDPDNECNQSGLELPVAEYGHGDGCSVTGGYVYRGKRLPSLYGAYVYGDYCSGKISALRYADGRVTERLMVVLVGSVAISGFGEDQDGEVYVLDHSGGGIYRLVEE
jgi:glucose/arabinose dehydrogenase